MKIARKLALRNRAVRRRAARKWADATIEQTGLGGTPLGRSLAGDLGTLHAEKAELILIVDRVGRTNSQGELTEPYSKLLNTVERSLVLTRELVDRLAELVAAQPRAPEGEVIYRILDASGEPFAFGTGMDAPRSRVLADALASDPLALPASIDAPRPNVARSATLLGAHPGDVRVPKAAPMPKPQVTIESPAQRRWRTGEDAFDD
jgi:hypothetical protein